MRRAVAVLLGLLLFAPVRTPAYSVLAHEAIIDVLWDSNIRPLLLKRIPNASPDDLVKAHAYAYGGSIIQDMGYYPHGSKFFSDLTHYFRSGDFIISLLRNASDINEYASFMSKPGPPQFVQDVTGLGRFMVGPTELSACPGGQHPFSFFQASL